MAILRNSKENMTNIRCLMKTNLEHIYHAYCQEELNEALEVVALEIDKSNPDYFTNFGTTVTTAKFNVQIKHGKLSNHATQQHH
eukprot:3218100-Ditylum_brightwellii.AAC.1